MPSKSTVTVAMRIPRDTHEKFMQDPYKGNMGVLMRVFLDDYFGGRLPLVKKKFELALAKRKISLEKSA